MCGICGWWNFASAEPVDPVILAEMTTTMNRRGPDDEGYYIHGSIGLGHRRLAIIDLHTGKQPISNEDGTIWIVFNGEIYNCRELGRELERQGHRFVTTSDTEVIVHAYEAYGRGCVQHLNGMFAFAIWDQPQQRLFLARDRAGIKPLHYTEVGGRFLFASELKAILAHPAVERRIDTVALHQYLAYEYVPSPRTIFEGIRKLRAGTTLTVTKSKILEETYWDARLAESEHAPFIDEKTYCAELKTTLGEVVRQELISDVPVGVLLSGGIDSSAVAAMMVHHTSGPVQSFSIGFEDQSFDESRHAALVAQHLGLEHHEATLTAERMLELIPRIAEFLDEPLGDSSIVPTYLLSEFTRGFVKVALGGDGGDELFGGYPTLQAHRVADCCTRWLPRMVRLGWLPWLVDKLPVSFDNISWDFKARRFVAGLGLPPVARHHRWLGSFAADERVRLLGPAAERYENEVEAVAQSHATASGAQELINQVLYCDMKLYLEGDILLKVDRASMANSLEVRVPLLNQKMVAFAQRVPHRLKLKGFQTKYLLRQAVKDLLPQSIVERPKKGFNMPVAKWLTGPLRPLVEDMFAPDRLQREGLFEPQFVRHLLDEHLARRRDNRKQLWTLLVFELWYDKWMKKTK